MTRARRTSAWSPRFKRLKRSSEWSSSTGRRISSQYGERRIKKEKRKKKKEKKFQRSFLEIDRRSRFSPRCLYAESLRYWSRSRFRSFRSVVEIVAGGREGKIEDIDPEIEISLAKEHLAERGTKILRDRTVRHLVCFEVFWTVFSVHRQSPKNRWNTVTRVVNARSPRSEFQRVSFATVRRECWPNLDTYVCLIVSFFRLYAFPNPVDATTRFFASGRIRICKIRRKNTSFKASVNLKITWLVWN